ncbi:MAG TPA: sigma-E factor negative regulatory protein [Povalibacter sp.]|nr:sigma-E factor negative regulatory protein [Povalibacter sp.]
MTDPVKEQLSACLDGELPEGELDLLLRQLQRDPQLRQSLGRYSLVGEAVRGQRPVCASEGFADRVAAAVAAESVAAETSGRPVRKVSSARVVEWLRPVAGMAIAAGVAAVAVISLRPAATIESAQMAATTETAGIESSEPASYTVPTNIDSSPGAAFVPAARLTNYVVAHSEFSSPLGRRTVLSGVLSDDDQNPNDDDIEVKVSGTPQSSNGGSAESQR